MRLVISGNDNLETTLHVCLVSRLLRVCLAYRYRGISIGIHVRFLESAKFATGIYLLKSFYLIPWGCSDPLVESLQCSQS